MPAEPRPAAAGGETAIVFHSGTLGDVVLTFWVLRALASRGTVWLVAPWRAAQLAARCVDGVVPIDGDHPRFARLHAPAAVTPDDDLAAALGSAASIISFVARRDDPWADRVRALAPRARLAFVAPRPPDGAGEHVTESFAAQLDAVLPLGRPGDWPAPRAAHAEPAGSEAPPVLLHPGSGAAAKCWPADRFVALGRALTARGQRVRFVLGEVEYERWTEAAVRALRAEFDVRLTATLAELEALLRIAAAFVGNDSGPAHLAAALGVRTIALFGPTSPAVWRPVGADVTVLAPAAPAPMTWLDADTAASAVAAALGRPLEDGGGRSAQRFDQ